MINKDAISHIQETAIKPKERIIFESNDHYFIDNNGYANLLPRREEELAQEPLILHTLSGLISYIKSKSDRGVESLFLQVVDEKKVTLKGKLNVDGNRETLATVKAIIPNFNFNTFYDSESLNIALQAIFLNSEDREILLKVVGNIVEEKTKTIGDDGVSQSVIVKNGTTSRAEVKVPNPVALTPYRTFIEVEQPQSKFIFRMKDGGSGAIFEADGGAWRNVAIANVAGFLEEELKKEIEDKRITILA